MTASRGRRVALPPSARPSPSARKLVEHHLGLGGEPETTPYATQFRLSDRQPCRCRARATGRRVGVGRRVRTLTRHTEHRTGGRGQVKNSTEPGGNASCRTRARNLRPHGGAQPGRPRSSVSSWPLGDTGGVDQQPPRSAVSQPRREPPERADGVAEPESSATASTSTPRVLQGPHGRDAQSHRGIAGLAVPVPWRGGSPLRPTRTRRHARSASQSAIRPSAPRPPVIR